MTNYEKLIHMSEEELADWLAELAPDAELWDRWWSLHYCSGCPRVTGNDKSVFTGRPLEMSYCEVHSKCFFTKGFPTPISMVKAWLAADTEKD